MSTFFITGTDTEVGKTIATGLLAKAILDLNKQVLTQKWIQSGLNSYPEDIATHLTLMQKNKEELSPFLKAMCPYRFQLPASAHLAAKEENRSINSDYLFSCSTALQKQCDVLLIEGLGGLQVPINDQLLLIDLLEQAKFPVILCIDNKLGAINHSLLSIEALQARKIPIAGLVFNQRSQIDPLIAQDNKIIIEQFSHCKSIATIPYGEPYQLLKETHPFWDKLEQN